jgi:hypothetical protein
MAFSFNRNVLNLGRSIQAGTLRAYATFAQAFVPSGRYSVIFGVRLQTDDEIRLLLALAAH